MLPMSYLKVSTVLQVYHKVVWSERDAINPIVPTVVAAMRAVSVCKKVGFRVELEDPEMAFNVKEAR